MVKQKSMTDRVISNADDDGSWPEAPVESQQTLSFLVYSLNLSA